MAEEAGRPGPLAGPYCTMLLADLGADVIKVESPAGDDTRSWVPPTRDGVATYYLAINRNKRSVVLKLKDAESSADSAELARRADIMVENFIPGGLSKYALDYDAVASFFFQAEDGIRDYKVTGVQTCAL